MISFGRHICNDYGFSIEKEWLLTNKKGSYASSTILLANTRKYHGLLVAKFPELDNRVVLFPNCDEDVEIAGHIYQISTHQYKKTVFPRGFHLLENFSIKDDVVTFLYLIDNVRIQKDIYLMKEENTTVITYKVLTPHSFAKMHVKPFIAFREPEHLLKEMAIFDPEIEVTGGEKIKVEAYKNMPPAYIYNPDKGEVKADGVWYRDFFYIKEEQQGFDSTEDLYNVATITLELEYNNPKTIIFSTHDYDKIDKKHFSVEHKKQVKRINDICGKVGVCVKDDNFKEPIRQLIYAAESFSVEKEDKRQCMVAGYPYPHYVWMRDTFASIPGIFLVLGKFLEARKILTETIALENNGLLPTAMTMNGNEMRYASVDTSLWFFYALNKYLHYTNDYDIAKPDSELFKRSTWIIDRYIKGTDFNIHMDSDGLIYAGFPGTQLTWMDNKVDGLPLTPRVGKPVEVNALWYNAIRTMQNIAEKNKDSKMAASYKELADKVHKSFNESFWNPDTECLYDFFDGPYKDMDIRPNQIMALSLPYPLIDERQKREKIMNVLIKELYTSFGMRTLSNMSVNFKPRYEGNQAARDRAIHQGTVWAWTVGHFVTAYLKTYGREKESLQFIETVYEPVFEHLKTAGLGTISEMFDGDFPYTARGRISHAWAVAEVLRSYFEDYIGENGKE